MQSYFRGFTYFLKGFSLITKPVLRRFVILPLLINFLLFAGLLWAATNWVQGTTKYLVTLLPTWLEWLSFLVWPVFLITGFFILFFGFTIIANFIAAPFNGLLAEATEQHLTGQKVEGDWKQLLKDVAPALWSELRKLLYYLLRLIPLGILFIIPVLNIAAPVLWAMFGMWMLAIQYADYPMGNHRIFFAEQRRSLRKKRLTSLGFGSGVMLFTLIPVLNFFVMPVAVTGATLMCIKEGHLGAR